MPRFSIHSQIILATCDPRLHEIFDEVIKHIDCRAISGKRNKEEQDALFYAGKTQLRYPQSYHNAEPLSKAIDIMPYPIDWNDRERTTLFAGFVLGVAKSKGYTLTWGGDWNADYLVSDNIFDDMAHFQIED